MPAFHKNFPDATIRRAASSGGFSMKRTTSKPRPTRPSDLLIAVAGLGAIGDDADHDYGVARGGKLDRVAERAAKGREAA